jgi:hypothetical protein
VLSKDNYDSKTQNMKSNWRGSIPYNHTGSKYGLADKYPVSYKRAGYFIADQAVAEDFIPIHINIKKLRGESHEQ